MRLKLLTRKLLMCLALAVFAMGCTPGIQAQSQATASVQKFAPTKAEGSDKPYYWDTMVRFKREDAERTPPANAILFIGSSSFTNWHNAQQMFPDYIIWNRGFGGSQLPDLNMYLTEVGYPEKVKQIVIYSGDNDIASGKQPQEVLERFKSVFAQIRSDKPNLPIAYVSIKECPGRAGNIPKVREANALIKDFLSKQKNAEFVDIVTPTLDANGKPLQEIYVADGVHMNQQGYDIWAKTLQPYLKK